MDEKQYKIDKMVNTLVDLASTEVEKAKQRGYFSKDFAEACCEVVKVANEMEQGGTGTYGNRRNDYPGYGGYGNTGRDGYGNTTRGGYGHYDEYEQGTGEGYGADGRKGERYGRSGERYN
jgi:hypothetical protein